MVSSEAAEVLVAGIEAALREVGVERPYLLGERVFRWIEENRFVFTAIRSRQAFLEFVQSLPDEAEPYLPLAMTLLQRIPEIAQVQIVQLLHQAASEHPLEVSPGRPRVMDDSMRLDICDDVSALFRKGVPLLDSQQRVAERYGVSVRSVQRVWRQRHTLPSEPNSLGEIFEAISKIGS